METLRGDKIGIFTGTTNKERNTTWKHDMIITRSDRDRILSVKQTTQNEREENLGNHLVLLSAPPPQKCLRSN